MVWSDHRRCNGKTLIPLHPDHVSKEILERYGTDVYGGFKPCQRYVKKNYVALITCDVSHEFDLYSSGRANSYNSWSKLSNAFRSSEGNLSSTSIPSIASS